MLLTVIGGDGVQAAKADQSTAASTGIECEAEFVVMCDSVHRRDPDEIAVARGALLEALGGDMNKLIDSVCIMAFFNGIADRTADATGLQVESNRAQTSIRFADKSSRLLSSSSSPLVQGPRPLSSAGKGAARVVSAAAQPETRAVLRGKGMLPVKLPAITKIIIFTSQHDIESPLVALSGKMLVLSRAGDPVAEDTQIPLPRVQHTHPEATTAGG